VNLSLLRRAVLLFLMAPKQSRRTATKAEVTVRTHHPQRPCVKDQT
jgi:hypothetical protein